MTEVTNRNQKRAELAAGGWSIAYGDLINEWDLVQLVVSIPTGTVAGWATEQIDAQLRKFQQSLRDVSKDVVNQAINYLQGLLSNKQAGETEINGVGVKAGIVTYNRHMEFRVAGRKVGSSALPNNFQPYIGVRVTKPLPRSGNPAPATPGPSTLDSRSWYKIKNTAKPGMALDVVNDGNQNNDAKLQMAADGNFSGQFWRLQPSTNSPGAYNLSTMWLGPSRCLDVYGDDKTRPHLTAAGNFSGQQWHVVPQGNGTWKLTNTYSGMLALAADSGGNGVHLRNPQTSSASAWTLQLIRRINPGEAKL